MPKYQATYTNCKRFEAANAEEAAAKAQSLIEDGTILTDEAAIEITELVDAVDPFAPANTDTTEAEKTADQAA